MLTSSSKQGGGGFNGAYTRAAETVALTGTKSWRKATFTLTGAKFTNGQNRGADFRLVVEAPEFAAPESL